MSHHSYRCFSESELDTIKSKSLFLIGSEDPLCGPEAVATLSRTGFRHRVVEDAGHGINHERGEDAVPVRQIAAASGIRESSVFNHFSGKSEIMERIYAEYLEKARQAWRSDDELDQMIELMNPEELFKDTLLRINQLMDSSFTNTARIILTERFKDPRAGELYFKTMIDQPVGFYTRLISKLIARGKVKPVDARNITARFNYGAIAVTMEYFMARNGIGDPHLPLRRLSDTITFYCNLMQR